MRERPRLWLGTAARVWLSAPVLGGWSCARRWLRCAPRAARARNDPLPQAAPRRRSTKFSLVAFAGGNGDVGFGGGHIASLARLRPQLEPYAHRLDTPGSVTFDGNGRRARPVRGCILALEIPARDPEPAGRGAARFLQLFVPLIAEQRRLVFAVRVVSALLFGSPLFYELPRFDVRDRRLEGRAGRARAALLRKNQAAGSFELRSEQLSARAFGLQRRLGLVAFVDTGRLWAAHERHPELDGGGPGLRYGRGGGLPGIRQDHHVALRPGLISRGGKASGYWLAGHMF